LKRSSEYYQIKVPKALELELRQKATQLGAASPAELIGWIAQEKMPIGFQLTEGEIEAMMQAIWTLRDTGQHGAALALIDLLRRSPNPELSSATCEHLEAMALSMPSMEVKLRQFITARQPFEIAYAKSGDQTKKYQCHFGQISSLPGERHQYLLAWITEPAESSEIPELAHNRSFRLDKIVHASPLVADWRNQGLDWVTGEFWLFNDLAHNYEARVWDIENIPEFEDSKLHRRRVICQVWSIWWLVKRRLAAYGSNCLIVSPQEARKFHLKEILKTQERYLALIDPPHTTH
jgi:predicted DNA-binding transcriptional regulator YafY